jgi:hypothetical protein
LLWFGLGWIDAFFGLAYVFFILDLKMKRAASDERVSEREAKKADVGLKKLEQLVEEWAKDHKKDAKDWLTALGKQRIYDLETLKQLSDDDKCWEVVWSRISEDEPILAVKLKVWKDGKLFDLVSAPSGRRKSLEANQDVPDQECFDDSLGGLLKFVNREESIKQLLNYAALNWKLSTRNSPSPKAFIVCSCAGAPGIGKSVLFEHAIFLTFFFRQVDVCPGGFSTRRGGPRPVSHRRCGRL